jgi:hypothetical protein
MNSLTLTHDVQREKLFHVVVTFYVFLLLFPAFKLRQWYESVWDTSPLFFGEMHFDLKKKKY